MQMRRQERSLTLLDDITAILDRCLIARLGFVTEDGPYVVPVNYGYVARDGRITVYVHGAPNGRKLSAIAADPRCCFETDQLIGLVEEGPGACGLSSFYESVIGFGDARVVTDPDEGQAALRAIVSRQAPQLADSAPPPPVGKVTVIAVDLHTIEGKAHRPT